jgi:hypothetical protein
MMFPTTSDKSDDEDGTGKCVSQRVGAGESPANSSPISHPFRADIPKALAGRDIRAGYVNA